jgi:hypothetical protein
VARVIVGLLVAAGFAAALVFATLRENRVACEVCVDFGSGSTCAKSSAASADEARQQAHSSACAVLAGGVTRGLECQRSAPRSVRCTE